MALGKSYMTPYGINAEYYLVSRVTTDKIAQSASITIYGYPNKETRMLPNSIPIDTRTISVYPIHYSNYFSIDDLENDINSNQYKQAYLFLKDHDGFFKDATDLLEEVGIEDNLGVYI